jgi:hypothetical protein
MLRWTHLWKFILSSQTSWHYKNLWHWFQTYVLYSYKNAPNLPSWEMSATCLVSSSQSTLVTSPHFFWSQSTSSMQKDPQMSFGFNMAVWSWKARIYDRTFLWGHVSQWYLFGINFGWCTDCFRSCQKPLLIHQLSNLWPFVYRGQKF